MADSRTGKVFLDRIEGKFGVLLLSEGGTETFDVPIRLLPEGVREGQMLKLTLEVDEDATRTVRAEVDTLMDDLLEGSSSG